MGELLFRVAVEQPGRKPNQASVPWIAWSGDPVRFGGAERRRHPLTGRVSLRREWFTHPVLIKKMKTTRARKRARAANKQIVGRLSKFYRKWKTLHWKSPALRIATIERVLAYYEEALKERKKRGGRPKGLMKKDLKKLKKHLKKWKREEGDKKLFATGKARRKKEREEWAVEKTKITERKRVAREEYKAEREQREEEAEASGESVSPPPKMEVTNPDDMTGDFGAAVGEWQSFMEKIERIGAYEKKEKERKNGKIRISKEMKALIKECLEDMKLMGNQRATDSPGSMPTLANFIHAEVSEDGSFVKLMNALSPIEMGLSFLLAGHKRGIGDRLVRINNFVTEKLDNAGPAAFNYRGYLVENPSRLSMDLLKRYLSAIDKMEEIFEGKELSGFVRESLSKILILPRVSRKASATYTASEKLITLHADALNKGQKGITGDAGFLVEVLVHEFGHHVHMDYITDDARKGYDKPWVDVLQKLYFGYKSKKELLVRMQEAHLAIRDRIWTSKEDRQEFFAKITKERGNLSKVRASLNGADRIKFMFWLHASSTIKTPFRLNVDSAWKDTIAKGFSEIEGISFDDYLFSIGMDEYEDNEGEMEGWREAVNQEKQDHHRRNEERRRTLRRLMGVGPDSSTQLDWEPLVQHDHIEKLSPIMTDEERELISVLGRSYSELAGALKERMDKFKFVDEMAEEYGLPTWYSKTNEKEDFAETFAWYILTPDKLKPKQIERMKECLRTSGEGGKEVFKRLAYRVASLFMQRQRSWRRSLN